MAIEAIETNAAGKEILDRFYVLAQARTAREVEFDLEDELVAATDHNGITSANIDDYDDASLAAITRELYKRHLHNETARDQKETIRDLEFDLMRRLIGFVGRTTVVSTLDGSATLDLYKRDEIGELAWDKRVAQFTGYLSPLQIALQEGKLYLQRKGSFFRAAKALHVSLLDDAGKPTVALRIEDN